MRKYLAIFKNKKFSGMLLSVVLAFFWWITTKLSMNYTQRVGVEVNYTNLPASQEVSPKSMKKIDLQIEGSGTALFNFKMFKNKINIDLSGLNPVGKDKYVIPKETMNFIDYSLLKDVRLKAIYPDTLVIVLERLKEKKIPVNVMVKSKIHPESKIVDARQSPPYVIAYGLEHSIDTIGEIDLKIETKKRELIRESFSRVIELPKYQGVKFSPDKVSISVNVVRVAEDVFKKYVHPINSPKKIKLFPQYVEVVVSGNINTIKNLKDSDIIITANYNNRKNGKIPLMVAKKPQEAKVSLSKKYVEFLIEK